MRYVFGAYTLDTRLYKLWHAGVWVRLEPKVFATLAYLLQHREHVVSRHELFEHLWPERCVSDAALERCIAVVRKALGDNRQVQRYIQTLPRKGYHFVATVEAPRRDPPDLRSRPAPAALGAPAAPTHERVNGTPSAAVPLGAQHGAQQGQPRSAVGYCASCQPTHHLEPAFCAACGTPLEVTRVSPAGRPETSR
jgi:DNA-binding winged helix-turn-helix (wHTH) protein